MSRDLEERLGRTLEEVLGERLLPGGDLAVAVAEGRRLRRRGRAVVAAVLSVLMVAGAGSWLLVRHVRPPEPVQPNGSWERLTDLPISPRTRPVVGWTGDELVVVGGDRGIGCRIEEIDCDLRDTPARDGAAYVPDLGWRRIAKAPVPVPALSWSTVAQGQLVLEAQDHLYAYDPVADAWRRLPDPEVGVSNLAAAGDGLLYGADVSGRVVSLDLATDRWSVVADDELGSGFTVSMVFSTDRGLAVAGSDATSSADLTEAAPLVVFVRDGDGWERMPATTATDRGFHWTGERLVSGEPFSRTAVDPFTGEVTRIPGFPDEEAATAFGGGDVMAFDGPLIADLGTVYDDRTQEWWVLERPPGDVDFGMSAAWVGDRLVVVGGAHFDDSPSREDLLSSVWAWSP